MTPDLYAILGLAKDASPDAIKAAYKAKAKVLHPDKGGDKDAFADLALAFEVLSDPERRATYDQTGRTAKPSAIEDDVKNCLAQAIARAAEEVVNQAWSGTEPHGNFVEQVKSQLRPTLGKLDNETRKLKRHIAVVKRGIANAKPKKAGQESAVLALMGGLLTNLEQFEQRITNDRLIVERALAMVDELEWVGASGPTQPQFRPIGFFNTTSA